MKFYDRTIELVTLKQIRERSTQAAQFTLLTGQRRVGKTALLHESFKKEQYLYLFVSRKAERLLCDEYQRAVADVLDLKIFGQIQSFKDLFEQLLIYSQSNHLNLVIDEFQDFSRINNSIFSEMQDLWDRYKDTAKINLIVCGSIYSLLTRLFEDNKEPLFGRLTSQITLKPFTPSTLKKILTDYNRSWTPDDLLSVYAFSGAVPKFVALLMDAGATDHDSIIKYIASAGSPFLTEGKDILISEFGKDYAVYFSILQLLASGKTSQPEIDSILDKSSGPYLANLEVDYNIVQKLRPLFSKSGSRNVRFKISDVYLTFWFRFIYANQALVEQQRYDTLTKLIKHDYNQYSGLMLERYFKDQTMEFGNYTQIGSYWDRKGQNEIDLIAISDIDKTALIAEVKRNAKQIDLAILKAKTSTVIGSLSNYELNYQGLSLVDM